MRFTTSQYEISSKNHIFSVKTNPQSIIYPQEKKVIGKSSILARGKSCVLPTDTLFRREIDYTPMYPSDRERSC